MLAFAIAALENPVVQTLNLMINRPQDAYAPCVDSVFRLFAKTFSFAVTPEPTATTTNSIQISYGTNAGNSTTAAPLLQIKRSPFFGPDFGKKPDPPAPPSALMAAADPAQFRALVGSAPDGGHVLNFDLPAAAFWLLHRYEEQVAPRQDAQGRFLCAYSLLPPEAYDTPLVQHWFRNFASMLHELAGQPALPPREQQQTIALTHDIDLMRKYNGMAGVRRVVSDVLRSPATGLKAARVAAPILLGKARDPYDSFDDLFMIKERVNAPSTMFLMAKSGGRDADYTLNDSGMRQLIMRSRGARDEFAVHTSWNSGNSAGSIKQEATAVGNATGGAVQGSRQHYLRVDLPQTWHHLSDAGIRYDSSLGFPDRSGFRCGWSGPFHPFDVAKMQELPVLEIPLICMDVTLASYEKIAAELCLERLTNLLDASSDFAPGGALVFLWHNVIADRRAYPGYWDVFEYFFSIASGSARFATLSQLCDEFDQR